MANPDMNLSVELSMVISASTSQSYNKAEVVKLLTTGADINFQDANRNFNTPLHLAIQRRNIELIKVLLDFKPSQKISNMNGERPRDFAMNLNHFDIVKLLDAHRETSKVLQSGVDHHHTFDNDSGVSLEPQSDYKLKKPTFYVSTRVEYILSISKIDPYFKRTSFDTEALKEIYAKLDENVSLRPLLKITKEIRNLEIYYLFDQENDELSSCNVNELTGTIFIYGPRNVAAISATLAHRILHYTLNHINDNDCKPYRRKQAEKMFKFKKIVTVYKRKIENLNPIMQHVFDFPEDLWDAELIACVPYILAFYHDDLPTLHTIIQHHQDLFDFYYGVVLKDIDDYLVRENLKRFKARPVEGSSFGKAKSYDPYKLERMDEKYGSNYRHNKRNNQDLERICVIL
ncbi:CLUMA_CG018176, isoform A [Clunio marinus]|uniref:CLUMA_CG018176, isoform A n=1 Tax=Clunio marinus TaxID=568069 RepID=A0A1J1J2R9_9DIPT|nr:CLUMA_CG018176, isoform A [Clunio marinus]